MRKDRIILDFVRNPVAQKIEVGRSVSSKMKNNPKFTTPDVSVVDLEALTDLLESRSVAALSGGKENTALLHQTEEEWDDTMRKMARYVDRIADGDGAVILNSGFNLAKQPAPPVRPEFSVELGEKSGTVTLRRQKEDGAKSYIWQYCTGDTPAAADSDWTTATVSVKVSTEIVGLTPMTKYWFRTAAVLSTGTTAYNAPVMQVVL
ncbi:MAG: fibronectin type III domain-containing protein [Bacteroidales bacterium]